MEARESRSRPAQGIVTVETRGFNLPDRKVYLYVPEDALLDRMLRWGVPLAGRAPGPTGGRASADLNRMSRRIGVVVLGLAVLIPMAAPLDEPVFHCFP